MNATSFLKRQQRIPTRRQSSTSTSASTSSLLSSCSFLTPKKKAVPQLQIIVEDSEDLSDSPRPSFSSGRSTPDRRKPNLSDIHLPKCYSEEDIFSNDAMLSAPRPAPRPPTPGSSSIHLSPRSASPASLSRSRSPSPLPQSITTRSATPSPSSSPDALHLSFQFPHPPTSPFSSPSSVSSGLPITPEESPAASPRFGPYIRADGLPCSLTRLKTIKPLTIVKRHDRELSFDQFFSSPISPSVYSTSGSFTEEELASEPISFASPVSPLVEKASCDPFVVIPSLHGPEFEVSDTEDEEEFYASSVSSLVTLRSTMPMIHKHEGFPRSRPESLAPPPPPPHLKCRVSKLLPDAPFTPSIPSPITPDDSRAGGKTCFPSAQLDPAWSRRSFLIPTRPPPPPPSPPRLSPSPPPASDSSPARKLRRPPSLTLTKPLPRSSVVPSDEVNTYSASVSVLSFEGVSPFADSDYLATAITPRTGFSSASDSSESSCVSASSTGRSEASSLPTSPSSDVDVFGLDVGGRMDELEVSLDGFHLDLDFALDVDMESELRLPVSLPGSPIPFTPVEATSSASFDTQEDLELQQPVLKSRWSSSTLSSVQMQSPVSSKVEKFKMYLRNHTGHLHNINTSIGATMTTTSPTLTSPRTKKSRRAGVVDVPLAGVIVPATTTDRKRSSTTRSSFSYSLPRSPKSKSLSRASTISSFTFSEYDAPLPSPTRSTSPSKPTKLSPAAMKRLGLSNEVEAAPPAALRRLGVGVECESLGRKRAARVRRGSLFLEDVESGSDEEGVVEGLGMGSMGRRKPIPVEMFLRA
ncbi:hypothetical protein L218DRAFT_1001851 [Marasmius fiardii PR-910]|nr:hypothetical protein L218DRAFT_1001851 [Marasmius fiardii PR-910]